MISVSDYLYKKAADNRVPLGGIFELSPVCNFSCKMCYVRKTPEQIRGEGKRLHTWQEWLELARQCRDAGLLYLLLTGGEPFLYPDFRQLYTSLHEMGFVLSVNTNGTLIDESTVAWLKEHAPQRLNITLYGASRETYQRVCGNASGFDKVMAAIDMLCEAGIPLVINCSMIPENEADMEAIVAIGKKYGINTRVGTYMFPPVRRDQEESDSRFSPENAAAMFVRKTRCLMSHEKYMEFLQTRSDSGKNSGDDWGSGEEYMRCRAGRSSFWVSWDGSMTACGIMSFPVTKYPFQQPFQACWEEMTDRIRNMTVLRECAGCENRELCMPCAAMLYAETGDVNRKAAYMCQMAEAARTIIDKEKKVYGIE